MSERERALAIRPTVEHAHLHGFVYRHLSVAEAHARDVARRREARALVQRSVVASSRPRHVDIHLRQSFQSNGLWGQLTLSVSWR